MENNELLEYIQKQCPGKFVKVRDTKTFLGEIKQSFLIARNDHLINGVSGQYAEVVSLRLDDGQWKYQIFGGNGGQYIKRNIDKNKENEKYNALGYEKMPSRLSKDYKKAIDKVCESYNVIIQDIATRGLTRGL